MVWPSTLYGTGPEGPIFPPAMSRPSPHALASRQGCHIGMCREFGCRGRMFRGHEHRLQMKSMSA